MKNIQSLILVFMILFVFGCNCSKMNDFVKSNDSSSIPRTGAPPATGPYSSLLVKQLRSGMTLSEVESVLGGSGVEEPSTSPLVMIKWGPDDAGRRLTIFFQEKKVTRWVHEIPRRAEND